MKVELTEKDIVHLEGVFAKALMFTLQSYYATQNDDLRDAYAKWAERTKFLLSKILKQTTFKNADSEP